MQYFALKKFTSKWSKALENIISLPNLKDLRKANFLRISSNRSNRLGVVFWSIYEEFLFNRRKYVNIDKEWIKLSTTNQYFKKQNHNCPFEILYKIFRCSTLWMTWLDTRIFVIFGWIIFLYKPRILTFLLKVSFKKIFLIFLCKIKIHCMKFRDLTKLLFRDFLMG